MIATFECKVKLKETMKCEKNILTSQLWRLNPKKIQLDLGDVLIREHRLWHRGTRNNSNKFREMVGVMLIKKENTKKIKEYLTKPKLYSNMFDNNLKGKLLEFIFLHFKILLVIYKLFLSLKSKQ